MLIGLAAKNAILIVEFAKARQRGGQGLVTAALEGAQAAAAADPDDVVRVHLRLRAALDCGRVGRGVAADSRHGRDQRHARPRRCWRIFLIPMLFVRGREAGHVAIAVARGGDDTRRRSPSAS